jgi:hypothetical protein
VKHQSVRHGASQIFLFKYTPETAYFVIPENVRHGEELICSYFACRNAGVKFRYCSHCKVPVAKRNFRKRHRHGDSDKSKGIMDDDDDSEGEGSRPEENGDADIDDHPAQLTAKMPAQEPGKMPAKETLKSSPLQDAMLAQQHQLNAQQLNAQQFSARQQPNAQQLNAQHIGASQQQQHALQHLNAQQQNALQHLSAQQQTALQQQLNAQQQLQQKQQNALQQLGGQKQQQFCAQVAAQLEAAKLQDRVALGSMPAHVASAAAMQIGNLLGETGNATGALSNSNGVTGLAPAAGLGAAPLGIGSIHGKAISETFAVPSGQRREKILLERTDKWLRLLASRPYTTNGDTMSAWLLEILTVSDLTMGNSNVGPSAPAPDSRIKEASNEKDEQDEDDEDEEEEDGEGVDEEGINDADDDEAGDGGGDYDGNDGGSLEGDSSGNDNDCKEEKRWDKKRSVGDSEQGGCSEAGTSVSFAEWRDRKKQKKTKRP